jgi:uncharacterized protein YgiM (DUF1202 family)
MAKNKSNAGVYFLYALPFLVGGALIYFYIRKKNKLKKKMSGTGGTVTGGTGTGGTGTGGTGTGGSKDKFEDVFYVATASSPLNVRDEPSTSGNKVTSLARGTKVLTRDSGTSGWLEVSTDGVTSLGYASTTFLSKTKPTTSSTTTTGSGSGSSSQSSGGYTGTGGTTSGSSGSGRPTSYVTYTQKYRVTTNSGTLNIRNAPNTSATILEKVAKDTILLGKPSSTSGWIEISKDGQKLFGYASNSFLSVVI